MTEAQAWLLLALVALIASAQMSRSGKTPDEIGGILIAVIAGICFFQYARAAW